MERLVNKRVLVGITGGIAAYKGAELVRRLKEAGAEVRVAMTGAATQFITQLTLQALSGRPVHLALLDPMEEGVLGHITLARWADMIVVAPARQGLQGELGDELGRRTGHRHAHLGPSLFETPHQLRALVGRDTAGDTDQHPLVDQSLHSLLSARRKGR